MSENRWEQYNCGDGEFITILPHSEFEVSEKVARVLLRNLGSIKWIVTVEDGPAIGSFITGTTTTTAPETPWCLECNSKGVRHKKVCTLK